MVEMDQKKINVVHKYFEDEFPECNIRVGYDYDRMAPKFQVFCKAENYVNGTNIAGFKRVANARIDQGAT